MLASLTAPPPRRRRQLHHPREDCWEDFGATARLHDHRLAGSSSAGDLRRSTRGTRRRKSPRKRRARRRQRTQSQRRPPLRLQATVRSASAVAAASVESLRGRGDLARRRLQQRQHRKGRELGPAREPCSDAPTAVPGPARRSPATALVTKRSTRKRSQKRTRSLRQ